MFSIYHLYNAMGHVLWMRCVVQGPIPVHPIPIELRMQNSAQFPEDESFEVASYRIRSSLIVFLDIGKWRSNFGCKSESSPAIIPQISVLAEAFVRATEHQPS